jgi:hypothetical protein
MIDILSKFQKKEVEEDLCVAVDARKSAATPFFDHVAGKLLIRGGKVVNDDGVVDADVLIDAAEGTILAVGSDLDVPGDCKVAKVFLFFKLVVRSGDQSLDLQLFVYCLIIAAEQQPEVMKI